MSENTENEELQEEKILTIEDILNAKIRKDEQNSEPIKVYIKSLGGNASFVKPTPKQVKKVGFKAMSNKLKDIDDAQRQLIYDCCPLIKQNYKKIREKYEVNSNLDIIDALFDADEQTQIILRLQGKSEEDTEKALEEIKNV